MMKAHTYQGQGVGSVEGGAEGEGEGAGGSGCFFFWRKVMGGLRMCGKMELSVRRSVWSWVSSLCRRSEWIMMVFCCSSILRVYQ